MQFGSTEMRLALLVAGLIVFAGGVAICKATPICSSETRAAAERPVLTSYAGEKKMLATQEKSQVHHARENNFASLVLEADVPVLVDFYADWCGPCRRLAPVLEELAAEMPHVRIVKVNVDDSPGLASEYGIDAIPSVKVFKDGVVTAEQVGLLSKSQLRAMLRR